MKKRFLLFILFTVSIFVNAQVSNLVKQLETVKLTDLAVPDVFKIEIIEYRFLC